MKDEQEQSDGPGWLPTSGDCVLFDAQPTGIIPPTVLERYYQLVALGLDREQAYMQAVLEESECIMESA